ncbi:MAG: pyruvate, phosphate dikinase [Candidatus Adiutrix sp.]|jgi:pyruvate,orthophosphate dikinase|nr:pyruvate, phosphate dikinase [Candidatus Adiutrix sp.]
MAASKLVYLFGGKKTDGNSSMKNLLGGKGANLAEMARIGLPVPAGFTITTEVCTAYYQNNAKYPAALKKEVEAALGHIEKTMGAVFGDAANPLLVSCRSGARASMPGMMDTVLNIGLNDRTVEGLIAKTGNPRFAYDSYRRFVAMYGDVVMGVKAASELAEDPFDEIIGHLKEKKHYKSDTDMTAEDLKWLVAEFKALIKKSLGVPFPEDPRDQMWGAIGAVFSSWMIPRAVSYRRIHDLPDAWGTAVNVQAMVFGNMGDNSATGVAFSRDPSTGENYFYGEYLINAQGEDVVAGIRTPNPINRSKPLPEGAKSTLADDMPKVYKELDQVRLTLEKHYKDMQDIEFTIQEGKLWMLQCRNGKRTAQAAVKIAVDLVKEKLIDEATAISRVEPEQLTQLLLPSFDPKAKRQVIATGLPASPGAAVGQAVFTASDAVAWAEAGKPVILVRLETSPEDINGMFRAQGILTARGGMTSHAAVVARGMGRTCVAGANDITVSYEKKRFVTKGGAIINEGDWISLDGSRGEIIKGQLPTIAAGLTGEFATLMKWVNAYKKIGVRTNADTPRDSRVARDLGAEGIGLCRTEHMFFEGDRITSMREMILAADAAGRQKALDKLLPMQRRDFYEIFKVMDGLPVTIRTLDPPLHEFLPHTDAEIAEVAKDIHANPADIKAKIEELKEQNPMLGHRGCRLGIVFPEITAMQARAIFEAAVQAGKEKVKVLPEIMIPLVGHEKEFRLQKEVVDRVAQEVSSETKTRLKYMVGTMIELPRACLSADRIVQAGAEFFSFGTNDLTQTTFGLSRDDAGKFLPSYLEEGIWEKDPFVTIDVPGVGFLVETGIAKGRLAAANLKIGICGEHGGDPATVQYCCRAGMNYVSCSPFRVPLARLAAAQQAIAEAQAKKAPAKAAAKPAAKAKAATKAAAKPTAKKAAAKAPAKPVAKAAAKPVAKAATKPTAKKAVATKPAAKATAKPAAKPAAKKAAAPKPTAKKPAAKAPAKPAAKKEPAKKPAAKPAAKKPASKK